MVIFVIYGRINPPRGNKSASSRLYLMVFIFLDTGVLLFMRLQLDLPVLFLIRRNVAVENSNK